jgi:hypothetical protein
MKTCDRVDTRETAAGHHEFTDIIEVRRKFPDVIRLI